MAKKTGSVRVSNTAKEGPLPPTIAISAPAISIKQPLQSEVEGEFNSRLIWILTALLAGFYYYYSTRSKGFYQQDEAGHFLGMLDFWNEPKSILGNWAKFGYKLIYVVPALLGGQVLVTIFNCVLAAGCAGLVAYCLRLKGSGLALAGFALLAFQPLWISLSFRNYSEVPTAFLLLGAYALHTRGRYVLSMLCVSYICTIRQEFFPILAMYGLDMLLKRRWIAAFSAALFPLLQNVYGWAMVGDPLYLLNQITGQAGAISDAYPRQGFDHYFILSMVIFGPVAVTLLVHYLGWNLLNRKAPDWYLVVPIVVFFLLQCVFNAQSFKIGPSTGGNLRYMLVIAPLVSIAGILGVSQFMLEEKNKIRALYYLVPLLAVTALYLGHKSDLLQLLDDTDNVPVVGVMAAGALLYAGSLPIKNWAIPVVVVLLAFLSVRPIKRSEEDTACQQLASWFKQNEGDYKGRQLYVNHVMFFYFLERVRHDFTPQPLFVSEETVSKASKGSVVLWDSHYAYRPKLNPRAVNYDYFTARPNEWRMTNQMVTPSQNFGVFVFERL
jgi:hypothetical protein